MTNISNPVLPVKIRTEVGEKGVKPIIFNEQMNDKNIYLVSRKYLQHIEFGKKENTKKGTSRNT